VQYDILVSCNTSYLLYIIVLAVVKFDGFFCIAACKLKFLTRLTELIVKLVSLCLLATVPEIISVICGDL